MPRFYLTDETMRSYVSKPSVNEVEDDMCSHCGESIPQPDEEIE